LFDLIAGVQVNLVRTANGVADVLFVGFEGIVEFPHQKGLFGHLGVHQRNGFHMTVGHAKNIVRLADQVGREHAAALTGNIDSQLAHGPDGMRRGRLAIQGAQSGGQHTELAPTAHGLAEQPLGHGAAANIAGANEQNGATRQLEIKGD
jgi:hypothetical protein